MKILQPTTSTTEMGALSTPYKISGNVLPTYFVCKTCESRTRESLINAATGGVLSRTAKVICGPVGFRML